MRRKTGDLRNEQAVERVTAACQQAAGRDSLIEPRRVLDLLDHDGAWRYASPGHSRVDPGPEKPDPRADPLTGCLPVTAEGNRK